MKNIEWVAGLLEGEGTFIPGPPSKPHMPILVCEMTDEDVLRKLADCLDINSVTPVKKRQEHWKQSYVVQLRGSRAVSVMQELRPYMGSRRQKQIDKAIACYENKRGKTTEEQRKKAVERLNAGESAHEIAKEYGVSHWAIYRMRDAQRKLNTGP